MSFIHNWKGKCGCICVFVCAENDSLHVIYMYVYMYLPSSYMGWLCEEGGRERGKAYSVAAWFDWRLRPTHHPRFFLKSFSRHFIKVVQLTSGIIVVGIIVFLWLFLR